MTISRRFSLSTRVSDLSKAMTRSVRSAIYTNLAAVLTGEVILFIKDLHELISGNSDGREGINFPW
jgi:hypothetical protein